MTSSNSLDTQQTFDLEPGTPVFAADGNRLGTVKEVEGTYFKIDVRLARDYWLDQDCIAYTGETGVTLALASEDVGTYKLKNPRQDLTIEEPRTDPGQDSLITTEEQMDQRERMERQLEDQRRNLPNN